MGINVNRILFMEGHYPTIPLQEKEVCGLPVSCGPPKEGWGPLPGIGWWPATFYLQWI